MISEGPKKEELTLSFWLRLLWRRKWVLILFLSAGVLASWLYTKSLTPRYRAAAQVVIELSAPQYLAQGSTEVLRLGTGNTWNTSEFFETQYRIIRSRSVAQVVIEKLNLENNYDFLGLSQIKDEALRQELFERADASKRLIERIKVHALANSHVVLIEVEDTDAERAAQIANALAEAYEAQNVGRKVSAAQAAVTWLRGQALSLERALRSAQEALLDFKREHNIVGASLNDRQNLLALDLQDVKKRLREASLEVGVLRSQVEQIKRLDLEAAASTVEAVLSNTLVQRLKEQKVALENEQEELLKRYLDKHPDVLTNQAKIERVQRTLVQEVQGITQALERSYRAAAKVEQRLAGELAELEREARALQSRELEYRRLEDQAQGQKDLYASLLVRLKEAELQTEADANNVRLLDAAQPPLLPVYPRLMLNVAVAAFLSLLGGLALAFLLELLDRTVKSQEELEQRYGLTFLGIMPTVGAGRSDSHFEGGGSGRVDHYILENPSSTAAEHVRTIRTSLLFASPDQQLRSMVVTSAGPQEGKTYTCTNIAAAIAQADTRVLLVDSDLRRPRIHKVWGMENQRGLTDLIRDEHADIASLVQDPQVPNLTVMTTGALPPNPAELLQSKSFERALERLKAHYDLVIFDSPPVVAVTDAQLIGRKVDGALLVVRAGRTQRDMLEKTVRLLRDVNVRIFGALLNDLDVHRRGYGQVYYRYYRQHGEYGRDAS